MSNQKKFAEDLEPGDKTEWYTIRKVRKEGGKVIAEVLFNDGGTGERVWDDPLTLIPVVS